MGLSNGFESVKLSTDRAGKAEVSTPHRLHAIQSSRVGCFRNGISLYLKIDTGDLRTALPLETMGALAELGELRMAALSQFHPRGGQKDVDIYACLPFELEEHIHNACIVGAADQHPATATENCAREGLHQSLRLFPADGLHLHRPAGSYLFPHIAVVHTYPRNQPIGARQKFVYPKTH